MPLIFVEHKYRMVPFNATWICRYLVTTNLRSTLCCIVALAFLGTLMVMGQHQEKATTQILAMLLLFPIIGILCQLFSPFAFMILLSKSAVCAHYRDILTDVQKGVAPFFTETKRIYINPLFEYMKSHQSPSAIALRFNETLSWKTGLHPACYLYHTNPDTGDLAYNRHVMHRTIDPNTSLFTGFLCRLAAWSNIGHKVTVFFPLEGHFEGSAHERLSLNASLETHKDNLMFS